MVFSGQTLKHKTRNTLVRVAPQTFDNLYSSTKKTQFVLFIDKEGYYFQDALSNYTYIKDEYGRRYTHSPTNQRFVDESAEKYLCSKKEMLKMRKRSLLEWEKKILERMAGINCKPRDIPGKSVVNPFSDSRHINSMAEAFFLKRRKAVPLIAEWSKSYKKDKKDGFVPQATTMCFYHTDHKMWLNSTYNMVVIDIRALKKVLSLIKP